jgi:hypothetical protein
LPVLDEEPKASGSNPAQKEKAMDLGSFMFGFVMGIVAAIIYGGVVNIWTKR